MSNALVPWFGGFGSAARRIAWMGVAVLAAACAHHQPVRHDGNTAVYVAAAPGAPLIERFAPVFVVYEAADAFNRIGTPEVVRRDGKNVVEVSAEAPAVYVTSRTFKTARATYTNLVYRVHFPQIPYRLIPFNLTAGDNVGLMVVVTLDGEGRPMLVTTVHTCGCYMAITPTDHLSADMYPIDWKPGPVDVYGERLPGQLVFDGVDMPRLRVHLRPSVHRVMHLEVVDEASVTSGPPEPIPMPVRDMADLESLPLPGGGTASFYYGDGSMAGHVKGSWKPLETLFLGLISLDYAVGTDKAYQDSAVTGNPFYTSLKFWNRNASDMWHFDRFFSFWGWRL
jgi:hypothetical protein